MLDVTITISDIHERELATKGIHSKSDITDYIQKSLKESLKPKDEKRKDTLQQMKPKLIKPQPNFPK